MEENNLLKVKLDAIQKQLQLKIDEIRASLKHHGNKGNWAESSFRDVLKLFLPQLYDVGHGEIINSSGDGTGQIDIVITNQYHPMMCILTIFPVFFSLRVWLQLVR